MTRINCIPVEELVNEHLVAEYKELPRAAKLAFKRFDKDPNYKPPSTYRLGTGHVMFFLDKGQWLADRHAQLVAEMRRRGMQVNFPTYPDYHPQQWMGNWEPTEEAMRLNRERIHERLIKMGKA